MGTSTKPRAGSRVGSRVGGRLAKAPTGIRGFDQVTDGGLPRGRPTLVTGASGSGKTLFGIEFLVRGGARLRRARGVADVRGIGC